MSEAVQSVLCLILTFFGLNFVLRGVGMATTFRTNPGWDMSKNPPEFCRDGVPLGNDVRVFGLLAIVVGVVLICFTFPFLYVNVATLTDITNFNN